MKPTKLTPPKKLILILSTIFFIGLTMQISSPDIVNPPVVSEINAPREVKAIFERACYDCHSNKTEPEWFNKIAPISYLVADDIKNARARFNFSEWDQVPKAQQEVLLWEIVNVVIEKKMPLKRYRVVHPNAAITADDIDVLKKYVNTLPGRSKVDTSRIIRANDPLSAAHSTGQKTKVPTTLNGISYSADYKNWKVISSTDKFDSGTMRIVYGNDIMVKALENQQMPFPDGAQIVKVVWGKQREDKDGNNFPGNFVNVQIMIKDSKKYKDTEGWGFAKFDGPELKPYGKTALFTTSCINCHRLLAPENDFVFNIPTR
jgi:hypothetical protein